MQLLYSYNMYTAYMKPNHRRNKKSILQISFFRYVDDVMSLNNPQIS